MLTIVDAILETARRHATRVAVQDSETTLTYDELAQRIGRIAGALSRGLDRPGPVAVLTPHDASSVTALLGALASGRGVIPLDVDHPDARNRLIAGHSTAVGIVTTSAIAPRARALFASDAAKVIEIDRLDGVDGPAPAPPSPGDLAYVLYTSGSTGAPKGAFQLHGPLLADLVHSVESFGLTPDDRAAVFYPPAVAAGLRGLLGTLLAGASAHLLAPRMLGRQGLAGEIHTRGITVFRSSAALFRHVAGVGKGGLDSLRLVALGGDRVDWNDYDAFRRVCAPQARFASHLGATECSLYAEWMVDEAARGDGGALPVGRAIPGYRITLANPDGTDAAEGEVGEFVIESERVAQGYWLDPDRTAQAFGPGKAAGLRTYRTGDLGRRRPDGLYEVAGRRDHQIKLRGYRIELGEIESALRACSGVKDAAVLTRSGADGAVHSLAAYVELESGVAGLLPRHLQSMLAQKLPAHMIPADMTLIDALPWLANFKIDRQRLEVMDAARRTPGQDVAADPVTAQIVLAFESVLRLTGVTPEDDLMSLAGDSLQAVDIALEIELRLGVRVNPEELDMLCPIGELAGRLGLSGRRVTPVQ